jgi:hypothetical protein
MRSTAENDALHNHGTDWRFIPKRAPWFGGWWERLIGLTKTIIKKVFSYQLREPPDNSTRDCGYNERQTAYLRHFRYRRRGPMNPGVLALWKTCYIPSIWRQNTRTIDCCNVWHNKKGNWSVIIVYDGVMNILRHDLSTTEQQEFGLVMLYRLITNHQG